MLKCTHDWFNNFSRNNSTHVLYTDISKAFDSVVHRKLISILKSYGINPELVCWLANFLNDREQMVVINDTFSSPCKISSGIPQGSIIGPLLFLIYLNDIDVCTAPLGDSGGLSLFADDAKFYSTDPIRLQNSLDLLEGWLKNRQLKLATNKCFVLNVSKKTTNFQFSLNDTPVSSVSSFKDLGIFVSSNLKWNVHINYIYNNAIVPFYYITKFTKSKNLWTLLKLYKTFIRPKLEFNTQVWSPSFAKDIRKIEKIQKDYTRAIFKRCNISYTSYSDRLYKLNLRSLEYRRVSFDLVFMFKIIHNISGLQFSDFLKYRPQNYILRNNINNIETIEHFKTNNWTSSFFPRTVLVWNKLPLNIVSSSSLQLFKSNLDKFDLNKITNLKFP